MKHQQTGKICALKVISRQSSNEPIAEQIEKEVTTKIDHPFIIKLNDSFKTPNKVYLVMDFLSYGDILSLTSKRGILREEEAKFYIIEIILALEHLHKMNIIHKNLKPDNILISKEGHVVVTDYGLQTVSHSVYLLYLLFFSVYFSLFFYFFFSLFHFLFPYFFLFLYRLTMVNL